LVIGKNLLRLLYGLITSEGDTLANLVYWKDKPVALSIVQARLVGYIFTYAAFFIASTSGRFGSSKKWV
jgi:hypothetical protein